MIASKCGAPIAGASEPAPRVGQDPGLSPVRHAHPGPGVPDLLVVHDRPRVMLPQPMPKAAACRPLCRERSGGTNCGFISFEQCMGGDAGRRRLYAQPDVAPKCINCEHGLRSILETLRRPSKRKTRGSALEFLRPHVDSRSA